MNERRLEDRILYALQLALEQRNLLVAEHLKDALDATMTGFGGPGAVERRDIPDAAVEANAALDALRREAASAGT